MGAKVISTRLSRDLLRESKKPVALPDDDVQGGISSSSQAG